MRVYFDSDDDRSLLASRLARPESVADADLAASFGAWIEGKPVKPARGRRLTAADLEALDPFLAQFDEAHEGGYANNMTGWIGAG